MATVMSGGSRQPNNYLFVDGGSLLMSVRRLGDLYWPGLDVTPELDFERLGGGYQKCFFYDAYPAQKSGEEERLYQHRVKRHDDRMNRVNDSPFWHAYEGETRYRKKRGQEQKMVDVLIAVDMLRHAFNGNMERATLFTTDLDFKPAIEALVQAGIQTQIWYDPAATNDDLRRAADIQNPFNTQGLVNMLTVDWLATHPLPHATREPYAFNDHICALEGALSDGKPWRLFRHIRTNAWSFVWPERTPQGYWNSIHSLDLRHLTVFLTDVYGYEVPVNLAENLNSLK